MSLLRPEFAPGFRIRTRWRALHSPPPALSEATIAAIRAALQLPTDDDGERLVAAVMARVRASRVDAT